MLFSFSRGFRGNFSVNFEKFSKVFDSCFVTSVGQKTQRRRSSVEDADMI